MSGVSEDFEVFLDRELPTLLRYAFMLTGDPDLSRDLVQDVALKAHVRWAQIGEVDHPRLYLRTMVTNAFLSWRRRWSVRNFVGGSTHPMLEGASVADPAIGIDERDAMWQRLAGLPRQQRAVLVLRYYEGLPDAEIADILHCTAGTVRSHASRALGTLRTQLTQSTDVHVEQHQEHR